MIFLAFYCAGMLFTAGTFLETLVRLKRGTLVAHSPVALFGGMFLVLLFWPYLMYRMFTQTASEEDHSWLVSEPIRPIFFKDDADIQEPPTEFFIDAEFDVDMEKFLELNRALAADFDAAWKNMELRGYRYGEEALSNVRVGWDMAQAEIAKRDARIAELEQFQEAVSQALFEMDYGDPEHVIHMHSKDLPDYYRSLCAEVSELADLLPEVG